MAVNKSGRLGVVDSLERVVGELSDKFGVSGRQRELGLGFLTSRLEWLAGHRVYDVMTESITRDELQQFYYERGVIPINTAEGPKRIKRPRDLRLLSAFSLGILSRGNRYDEEAFRHYRRIVKRSDEGGGPSRADMIDQHGQMEELRSYYGRPVSYDDVLPVWEVMCRYLSGQRAIIIQIGEKQVDMVPETVDDLWVLNLSFIKLRINGALVNERLYYFWRRVENGENGAKEGTADGNSPWAALINHEGRQKRAIAYLDTAATWEAVASNPKAKFIKFGSLPSRELVRMGVLDMLRERKRQESGVPEGRYRSSDAKPAQAPPIAPPIISSYDELYEELFSVFGGYVPEGQLAAKVFKANIKRLLSERPVSEHEALELARTLGVRPSKGVTAERVANKIIAEIPRLDTIRMLPKPAEQIKSGEEIENAPLYYVLKGTEPIKRVLYSALEKAAKEIRPDFSQRAAHHAISAIIPVLEEGGVRNKGDLEEILQKGWSAIQAVRGLVSVEPAKRGRLAYFLRACQILGYKVPDEALAASPLKYFGKDSKPVKDAFRPYVKQAIREIHDWGEMSINQAAAGTIAALEANGILFMSQLEELLQKGWQTIQTLKGLNAEPSGRSMLAYFLRACQILGYKVPDEALAASPLKYFGKDSKPVKDAFRPYVKEAVIRYNPDFGKIAVNHAVGGVISCLERGGIIFMSDLEERTRNGDGIQKLTMLFGTTPPKTKRLTYFLEALEISGLHGGAGAAGAAPAALAALSA